MPWYPRWTAEEEDRLKASYPTLPRAELMQAFPGKSFQAIQVKARKFGLKRNGATSWRPYRNPFRRPLTEAELAYIAGIIDGEGSIGFNRVHRGTGRWLVYTPRVGVSNQSETLIRWMDERIVWCSNNLGAQTGGYGWAYKPYIHGHRCATLLQALLPYLLIKPTQAQLVIKFCDSRAPVPPGTPYSSEEIAMVEQVYALNRKKAQPTSALSLSRQSA